MSLEEVGVLTTEMLPSGILCGKGLLAVGWKEVCRQPCVSWQFPEGPPELQLCGEVLTADHALPGAPASDAICRHGV